MIRRMKRRLGRCETPGCWSRQAAMLGFGRPGGGVWVCAVCEGLAIIGEKLRRL